MARMVQCTKLHKESEGLDFFPLPGELGKLLYDSVSKEAWQDWLKQQTILINENRLNMSDPNARQYLIKETRKYFFGDKVDHVS
ncbi:MAG: oxidative damage protection protein [Burkholderia sp.]|nr:oxidative damage protection protein [Burkholderia sp.]